MVSEKGDYEQWVSFFLEGVIKTSESAIITTKKILHLQEEDKKKLYEQSSSILSIKLHDQLFYTPIMTAQTIQQFLNVSHLTANSLILKFVKAGILKETTGQKRDKRYTYMEYVQILSEGAEPL
jgi:Fic family protein